MGEDDGPKTAAQRELDSELQVSVLHLSTVATYGCTLTTLRGPLSPHRVMRGFSGTESPKVVTLSVRPPYAPTVLPTIRPMDHPRPGHAQVVGSGFRVEGSECNRLRAFRPGYEPFGPDVFCVGRASRWRRADGQNIRTTPPTLCCPCVATQGVLS